MHQLFCAIFFLIFDHTGHIKDVHLPFSAHLINIFWGLSNVDIFPSEMLRRWIVCVIRNSNKIHSFIFTLCIMIVHTLKDAHLLFYAHFMNTFSFWGVLNLDIFMLRWFLFCVICNSKSFHSLIFKLCRLIVLTLNICLFFVQIFKAVILIHSFHLKCLGEESGLCNL